MRKWLWTDSAANASEHNDYCWWRGKKNDLAKRGILSHFINVLSCYCTLLCSQPFVIFNYLCLPCDCIFPQLFSVLLIVFATNIISFLFWDWGFTQHTQQRECAHMQSKPPRVQISKHNSSRCKRKREDISPPRIKLQTRCAKPNLKRNSIQTTLTNFLITQLSGVNKLHKAALVFK